MCEMLSTLDGAGYVVRRSLHDPKSIRLAKKAIRLAFETQVRGLGFSMVELLSTCPTNWNMTAVESLRSSWRTRWWPIFRWATTRSSAGCSTNKALME